MSLIKSDDPILATIEAFALLAVFIGVPCLLVAFYLVFSSGR